MAAHEALFCDHFAMAIHFIRFDVGMREFAQFYVANIYIYLLFLWGKKIDCQLPMLHVRIQYVKVCVRRPMHRVYMNYKSNSGIYGYSLSNASCLVLSVLLLFKANL